jgi:long-chain acyl-CoA synthetase
MYLTQGLHRCMQQTPERVAIRFGERTRTFAELGVRVARLAGAFRSLGMGEGDRVSMLGLNSDRYLEYMLSVWWAGGVLNPVNIRWSVQEIVYSLDDCETGILIVDDHFLSCADDIANTAARRPILIYAGDHTAPPGMLSYEQLIAATQPVEDALRGGNDLASIMYTGGTTGRPKGVMQSHLNLWSSAVARMAQFRNFDTTVSMHAAPLFHTAAMASAVGFFIGGDLQVVLPGFDARGVLEAVERHKVEELMLVPTMLQAVFEHPDFKRRDLSTLKRIYYGASPIAAGVLDAVLAALPGVRFYHAYGLTEASPVVSINPPRNHDPDGRASGLHRSAGRVGFGVMVKVVDPDGVEVPRNTVGEVIARGANVMLGYWNKPEETRAVLRNGWLHTGDGGYMDENGYLFIVDRLKDMIVTGGENVYSAEVENVMSRHPAVAQCAVIGVPDPAWGERVHAVVVVRAGHEVDEQALREHCRRFIAGYKCPKSIEFRVSLPLSATGKILKRDLRAPYWNNEARQVG